MAWGRREHGGLLYAQARVTASDDGRASVVLRRLGWRTYGRRRGQTGGPPRARHAYGSTATRLEASWAEVSVGRRGPRAAHGLGQRSRREGARGTAVEGRPAPAGDARRSGARRRGALAPDLKLCC
jgi:hypothetical protein